MLRQSRKLEHIKESLRLSAKATDGTLLQEMKLLHNCLPELDLADISLTTDFLGKTINAPLMINAITGGSEDVAVYNERLASLAAVLNIPMAVGSQFSAVEKTAMRSTFEIVRRANPQGVILANVGAHADLEQARTIVDMIEADALQIHINPAQELVMHEGDRCFRGYLANIAELAAKLPVPVVVKETGCGMSLEQIEQLVAAGIVNIDVSGLGGTNFVAIEAARKSGELREEILNWGIPTAVSIILGAQTLPSRGVLIAGGGILTPIQAAKALALGADLVSMAMYFLQKVMKEDNTQAAAAEFDGFVQELKMIMLLTGSAKATELRRQRVHFKPELSSWLQTYDLDIRAITKQRRCII